MFKKQSFSLHNLENGAKDTIFSEKMHDITYYIHCSSFF